MKSQCNITERCALHSQPRPRAKVLQQGLDTPIFWFAPVIRDHNPPPLSNPPYTATPPATTMKTVHLVQLADPFDNPFPPNASRKQMQVFEWLKYALPNFHEQYQFDAHSLFRASQRTIQCLKLYPVPRFRLCRASHDREMAPLLKNETFNIVFHRHTPMSSAPSWSYEIKFTENSKT
jgi:hypothetical protein